MWKNCRICQRVVIGCGLLFMMLGVMVYTGYSSILTLMDRSSKADEMQVMVKNLLEARRYEKSLIIRKESEYRDKALKSVAEIKRQALAAKENFRNADNKKMMDDVAMAVSVYEEAFIKLAGLVLAGGATTPEQADLDKKMVEAAKKAQEQCEAAVKDQKEEIIAAFDSVKRTVSVLMLGIVLLSITFAALLVRSIVAPIAKLVETAKKIAEGDMTTTVEIISNDEVGQLAATLGEVIKKLGELIGQASSVSAKSALFAHELHTEAEHIAHGIDNVVAQTATVATAGEEMSATSSDIARNCLMASEGAQRAAESARNGAAVVEGTIGIMSDIAENVRQSARTVEKLGERSDQIGAIIGTIEDIADQTNLLALNAAIEAARAGEQGRGFAVVADEVRALAERTTRATREIGEMIKAIQMETKGAVVAMETGVRQVETGTEEASKSGEALRDILEQVNDAAMQISQIATAAEQQTATTSEITSNMQQITDILRTAADDTHKSAQSTSRLNALVEELMSSFNHFKLNESLPLTITKAKSAHMIFIGKIKAHLDGVEKIDPEKLTTHKSCAFGQWYQSTGQQACSHSSNFRAIDIPHAKVHDLGKQALVAFNSGDRRKAQELCAAMVASSEELMSILDNLAAESR